MSSIEANITLALPDDASPDQIIAMIRNVLSEITGKPTDVHISEVDDPLTTNPIGPR